MISFLPFQVGAENAELGKLVELLPQIPYKGDSTAIDQDVDPAAFIPCKKFIKFSSFILHKHNGVLHCHIHAT